MKALSFLSPVISLPTFSVAGTTVSKELEPFEITTFTTPQMRQVGSESSTPVNCKASSADNSSLVAATLNPLTPETTEHQQDITDKVFITKIWSSGLYMYRVLTNSALSGKLEVR